MMLILGALLCAAVIGFGLEWWSLHRPAESIRSAIRDENLRRIHRAQLNTRPVYNVRSQEAIVR